MYTQIVTCLLVCAWLARQVDRKGNGSRSIWTVAHCEVFLSYPVDFNFVNYVVQESWEGNPSPIREAVK